MKQKVIVNESAQMLDIFLRTPSGVKSYLLKPQEVKVIPDTYVSDNILKLQRRRLLSVKNYS